MGHIRVLSTFRRNFEQSIPLQITQTLFKCSNSIFALETPLWFRESSDQEHQEQKITEKTLTLYKKNFIPLNFHHILTLNYRSTHVRSFMNLQHSPSIENKWKHRKLEKDKTRYVRCTWSHFDNFIYEGWRTREWRISKKTISLNLSQKIKF